MTLITYSIVSIFIIIWLSCEVFAIGYRTNFRESFGYYVELKNNQSCEVGKSYCQDDFEETGNSHFEGIWFCTLPDLLISKQSCTGNEQCERDSLTGQPVCISKWNCTAGHLYCGHKLKEISSLLHPTLAYLLQLNGIYQCGKESPDIWLTSTCDSECIQLTEGRICCNQPCKTNSTYCGAELNNLKCVLRYPPNHKTYTETKLDVLMVKYVSNYTANNLYGCKGSQQVELLENCSHTCTASNSDSYCDAKSKVCGIQPEDGSFPWMVSIRNPFSYGHYDEHKSDGILIGSAWVLTSGSVSPSLNINRNIISIGTEYSTDFYKGQIDAEIDAVVQHPGYDGDKENPDNLALVRLKSSVTVITPVCLTNASVSESAECILAGWGSRGPLPTLKLQHRKVKVFTKEICIEMFRNDSHELLASNNLVAYQNFNEGKICGFVVDRLIQCKGETGVLMCRNNTFSSWMATGMLIKGPVYGCKGGRQPVLLFTDLSAYYPWISNMTAANCAN